MLNSCLLPVGWHAQDRGCQVLLSLCWKPLAKPPGVALLLPAVFGAHWPTGQRMWLQQHPLLPAAVESALVSRLL